MGSWLSQEVISTLIGVLFNGLPLFGLLGMVYYLPAHHVALLATGFVAGCAWCKFGWMFAFPLELANAIGRTSDLIPPSEFVIRTTRRVMPFDLDMNMHQNNVRYIEYIQEERVKFFFRSGFWRAIRDNGAILALTEQQIRWRREIAPGQAYEVVTRPIGWLDNVMFLEQRFVTQTGRGGTMTNAIAYPRLKFKFSSKPGTAQSVAELWRSVGGFTLEQCTSPVWPGGLAKWDESIAENSAFLRKEAGLDNEDQKKTK
jgi:acyl-CoA thioesterase FadM